MARPATHRSPSAHHHAGQWRGRDDLRRQATTAARTTAAFALSTVRTAGLLARRRLRQPAARRNQVIRFGDGTRSRIYRHTEVTGQADDIDPVLLVMAFRLRGMGLNPTLHTLFRIESLATTPLFAGFAGFRSKLWTTDSTTGTYHGVYRWDGASRAAAYAETMCSLLRLVSVPGSVRYHVEPGTTPDTILGPPSPAADIPTERPAAEPAGEPAGQPAGQPSGAWWCPEPNAVTFDGR